MKSVLCIRLLASAFILSILAPSLSHSQSRVQMDSMYAAIQRDILREYPTAKFPRIPYEKYDTITTDAGDGTWDRSMRPAGEFYDECQLIFPEFEEWDVYTDETVINPMYQMYVMATFYMLDPETNVLLEGRGSKIVTRKEKRKKDAPDEYEVFDPESTAVFHEPDAPMQYKCEALHVCMPKEDPVYAMLPKDCPEDTYE